MRLISVGIVVIYMCVLAVGQDRPAWVSNLDAVIAKQEPSWSVSEKKVNDVSGYFTELLKFKSGSLGIEIHIENFSSAKEAKEAFDGQKIAFTDILQLDATKSTLEGLGDENYMFTEKGKLRKASLFLLQNNVVVKVFASSADIAMRFTKYVVDLIPHE